MSPFDSTQTITAVPSSLPLAARRPPPTSPPPVQPAAPAPAATTIGHIGRYALKSRLGEGGLGAVYAAHDPLLRRVIAVKTLRLQVQENEREAFNALFLNEARAAAGLSHPHIVTVYDAGISDDRAYIAMELLKGRDLRQLRQEGWRATPAQAAMIVRRVADALAFAHSKGVIHRDIKPANIFMVGRTQPRVLDFGIARIVRRQDVAEAPPTRVGSPHYMAPEQVRGEPGDRRVDVFSLGVVLYELLTDQRPFRGESIDEITRAVVDHEPPPAWKVDRSVPRALAAIAARAMAKDQTHRYRSARAFSRALRQWLDAHPASDDDAVVASPRRGWLPTAAGLAAVAVLSGVAWAALPPFSGFSALSSSSTQPPARAAELEVPVLAASSQASGPGIAPLAAVASPLVVDLVSSTAAPATSPPAPVPAAHSRQFPAAPALHAGAVSTATRERAGGKERRTREARERDAQAAAARVAVPAPATTLPAVAATGRVRIAISPWGAVEVDGSARGAAPPLSEIDLAEGQHQIVVRNGEFVPFTTAIDVRPGQTVTLRHRFGP